jgi:hypothetical protein
VLHMHCVVYFYPRVRKVQCSDHVIVATNMAIILLNRGEIYLIRAI